MSKLKTPHLDIHVGMSYTVLRSFGNDSHCIFRLVSEWEILEKKKLILFSFFIEKEKKNQENVSVGEMPKCQEYHFSFLREMRKRRMISEN